MSSPIIEGYAPQRAADDATFTFPAVIGHFRGIDVSAPVSTVTQNEDIVPIFDLQATYATATDEGIPPVTPAGCSTHFNGSCRTIFTNIAGGYKPTRIPFQTNEVTNLEPLIARNATLSPKQVCVPV